MGSGIIFSDQGMPSSERASVAGRGGIVSPRTNAPCKFAPRGILFRFRAHQPLITVRRPKGGTGGNCEGEGGWGRRRVGTRGEVVGIGTWVRMDAEMGCSVCDAGEVRMIVEA